MIFKKIRKINISKFQKISIIIKKIFLFYSYNYIKKCILNKLFFLNNILIYIPKKKILGFIIITFYYKFKLFFLKKKNIFINIIYENKLFIVINKYKNFIVHPGINNINNTMLNSLIYHYPNNINIPNFGIINRLDKYTSGLMLISKEINTYYFLKNEIKKNKIIKEYFSIVFGTLTSGGSIKNFINRDKKHIKRIVSKRGKYSITHYRIKKILKNFTLLKIRIYTGRTHQIRVHMNYINHPILGDCLYNKLNFFLSNKYKNLVNKNKQFLFSKKIIFKNPINRKYIKFSVLLPKLMIKLIKYLKNYDT